MLEILRQEMKKVKDDAAIIFALREPDNPYDDKAVAIYTRDPYYKLGYLPQKHHWVADAMDEGSEITVLIRHIRREGFFNKKYFVDLEIIPLRQAKPNKNKTYVRKASTTSRPKADWPTFLVTASVEELEDDILIDNKGRLHTQSEWITFDATLKAKDARNAVQRWARKHRRKLEKWWDENDRYELFESLEIYQLDVETNEKKKLLSISDEELEEYIEDGLDTSIEI